MLIRAEREAFGEYGKVVRGQTVEVSDFRARQLIRRGLFSSVEMEARPFENGLTGPDTQSSSSLADQAQQIAISSVPAAERASSSSMNPGGSRRSRTRSTLAMERGGNTTSRDMLSLLG